MSRKALELPQWMFDRAICCSMQAVETPLVGVRDLLALKALLHDAALSASDELPQNQLRCSKSKGDADAEATNPLPRRPTGTLLACPQDTRLAGAADRNQENHDNAPGQNVARPSCKSSELRRGRGGVR